MLEVCREKANSLTVLEKRVNLTNGLSSQATAKTSNHHVLRIHAGCTLDLANLGNTVSNSQSCSH